MTRPAAPGPQVGAGRLRVDAARAIKKLREYQLAERAAWVLEGIRAAVAARATKIVLSGDANDIWLAWEGAPWPAEDLPRLFDELVSPEAASERHHMRLLAAAVNSGLGMRPAYIDVIAIGEAGAHRARYTPDVLVEDGGDLEDSPLRKIAALPIPIPDGAAPGMLVHLRRRISLEVLSYLLGEPPELGLARARCWDIPIPLHIGDTIFHRPDHGRDVVHVPLGDGLDGFLAVVDPATQDGALMEIAERGVVLASYPLELGLDEPLSPLPIRLLIDAPRMPTNASRSEVQRGAHPIAAGEARAKQLVPALRDALATLLATDPTSSRARTAALALLASGVAGADWWSAHKLRASPFVELARLPLVEDATGARRPLLGSWRGLVYRGRQPLDEALRPWVEDILWVRPGDPAERLIAGAYHDPSELRRRLRWARRQRRAHDRFFAHEARPPAVLAKTLPLLRARLGAAVAGSCIPDGVFANLSGEICIYAHAGRSELVVLHHGREIERLAFDSPICFDAVIDAPALTPDERYRGVVRDAELARVDRAMRAGVLRAIEALASGTTSDGFVAGAPVPAAVFAHLIRGGLALARALGANLGPPLSTAPTWETADGSWVGLAAMTGRTMIGVADPGIEVQPVAGRLMLAAGFSERTLLDALAPHVLRIPYTAAHARPASPAALASRMLTSTRFALAITDDSRGGAIAPVPTHGASRIVLHHRGAAIVERSYAPRLLPCRIWVDSDAIVPNADWNDVLDDAGPLSHEFLAWEIALARVAARALIGDRSFDLYGAAEVELDGVLGAALCTALAKLDATELLGTELLGHLRAHRMWSVLGDPDPKSIDQLVTLFPTSIPYVARGALPVAGFSPVVADDALAGAVATLAGLPVQEAMLELESHRHASVREVRLAAHRAADARPIALPFDGESVAIAGPVVRGIVGVAPIAMEIHVHVEDRPFQVIHREAELPLVAVVEIDADRTNATFDGIPDDVLHEIIAKVTEAAPTLLTTIAAAHPQLLGDLGPPRTLFARWAQTDALVASANLELLRAAPMFATVDGARSSAADARGPRGVISTAAWTGPWLARDADPPRAHDGPILQISDSSGEIPTILARLFGRQVTDVTEGVQKLQSARRMARGLGPRPTVQGVPPELKRALADLGELGGKLGPGEIALVEDQFSSALLHVHGELRKVVPIDVLPAIQIAFEAPDLITEVERDVVADQLRALRREAGARQLTIPEAGELALRLTRKILNEVPLQTLTVGIRRNLARASLAGRLDPAELFGVPVFETTSPSWVDWAELDHQISLFGSAWSVPHASLAARPLDERRVVVRLSPEIVGAAAARGIAIIDATDELALDAAARLNRDKPVATTLAIHRTRSVPSALATADRILAEVPLDGDGVTRARGTVGVLHPAAAFRRGVQPHREMHPFVAMPDPCNWPTIAIVDDARLSPDRTWEKPISDQRWRETVDQIRVASARAVVQLVTPPAEALAVERIDGDGDDGTNVRRDATQLRGAVWLVGPPLTSPPLHLVEAHGEREWTLRDGAAIGGTVYVYAAGGSADLGIPTLRAKLHGPLLRTLVGRTDVAPDLVAAHAAHGLALQRILPFDARKLTFACFRPHPFDATELVAMFEGTNAVPIVSASDGRAGVIDDGTLLSGVVIEHLGRRALRSTPVRPPPAMFSTAPISPAAPRAQHPLQPLVELLGARLTDLGFAHQEVQIVGGEEPMFRHDELLRIAGDNPQLRELAAATASNSPWARPALDATVAHLVTVLNVALTQITDAAEAHALYVLLDDA